MSRALNLDVAIGDVVAMAARHNAEISAIEPLQPSGTRVVFVNAEGAAAVGHAYRAQLLKGEVTRTPWQQRRVT